MYKFSLTSIGVKILAVVITLLMVALCTVLIIFHNQVPLVAILFTCLVCLVCFIAVVLSFTRRIVVNLNKGKLIVSSFKKHKINIDEIKKFAINSKHSIDSKKHCNLEIGLLDGTIVIVSGYLSIFKKGDVQKNHNVVDNLNALLALLDERN